MTDPRLPYGTLYVVATPLGNLDDITFRAVETLKNVDLIAAEDTRHSKKLLNHYGITTRLLSCHEHNEIKKIPDLIFELKSGKSIALISDAGTPTISDPGYKLVAETAKENINIVPIPGCNAAIAGMSVSGLPTDSFLFLGFPPRKKNKLKEFLESLKTQTTTLIFYESPNRIKSLIENCLTIFGDRNACLAREITKIHEEFIRGSLSSILSALANKISIKGECSLVIRGAFRVKTIPSDDELVETIKQRLYQSNKSSSKIAKELSCLYAVPKNKIYNMIVKLKEQ